METSVFYIEGSYVFTVQRDGSPKTYRFNNHDVCIYSASARPTSEGLAKELSEMVDRPLNHESEGEVIYYISALPKGVGSATLIWLANKYEALILSNSLDLVSSRGP
jgi:hypothetical protein